jgi:hypothetical protein
LLALCFKVYQSSFAWQIDAGILPLFSMQAIEFELSALLT